jgi:hypothetical protein
MNVDLQTTPSWYVAKSPSRFYLDGLSYGFLDDTNMWCKPADLHPDLPRNFFCCEGICLPVSQFILSNSNRYSFNRLVIPREVKGLSRGDDDRDLSVVRQFGPFKIRFTGIRLQGIGDMPFEPRFTPLQINYGALSHVQIISICIPASVTILFGRCFHESESLSSVTFQFGSMLTRIESEAFSACSSLLSICIPASVAIIDKDCFR